MKKIVLTLILGNILTTVCSAQASVWKVQGNENTLYIGGTVHLLRPQDYPLPAEFDSAYVRSEKLVFETDVEALEDSATGQKMMLKGIYGDDRTLQNVLTNEVYAALEKKSLAMGLPLVNLSKFKPSMVSLVLITIKMKQMGISEEGVDKNYFKKGKTDDKLFSYLETVDEQIDILSRMGEGYENEFIKSFLKDFESMEKELTEMITTWRDGSAKNMLAQIVKMKEDYPALHKSLLIDRNNNWMPKIKKYLDDKTVEFIMVGALHLHGDDGILQKLKNEGYTVEQLMF